MSEKCSQCSFCGKIIKQGLVIAEGNNYCSVECFEDWTSLDEKCSQCGNVLFAKLENVPVVSEMYLPTKNGCCSVACYEQYKQELIKHEEIKHMAWEIYKNQKIFCYENKKSLIPESRERLQRCWLAASLFYNYAKEKEKEEGKNGD